MVAVAAVLDAEDVPEGRRRDSRSAAVRLQPGDHDVAVVPRVVDEQAAVHLEVGVERDAEKTPFAARVVDL